MGKTVNAFAHLILFAFILFVGGTALAQTPDDIGFFQKVLQYITDWGGLNWAAKVAGGIFLLIGAMKVSFLDKVWDFMGPYKAGVPLLLSLIAGIVSLAIDPGSSITWAGVTAYIVAGGGSIVLNSLLDFVKSIPGIGSLVVSIIDFLQIVLRSGGALESKKLAAKADLRKEMAA